MPQLTFDKDICPSRITVTLEWKQLANTWNITCLCSSQSEQIQAVLSSALPEPFDALQLTMVIQQLFHDWIDVTPGYATSMAAKALKGLIPTEVPVGLAVSDDQADRPPVGGRLPTYRTRRFPPRDY